MFVLVIWFGFPALIVIACIAQYVRDGGVDITHICLAVLWACVIVVVALWLAMGWLIVQSL